MPLEFHYTKCPHCGLPVEYQWDEGFISSPKTVLIADWVYHDECWDEVTDFPPPEVADDVHYP